jgi:hypothetical protein
MRFRKLRIAFSATCAIACVLPIVLWVRSYWSVEGLCYYGKQYNYEILSQEGNVEVRSYEDLFSYPVGFQLKHNPIVGDANPFADSSVRFTIGPERVVIPYWFYLLVTVSIGGTPWLRWSRRFSLRTLLIATTLVAMVLGAIVYAVR